MTHDDLDQELKLLCSDYIQSLSNKIEQIEKLWNKTDWDKDTLTNLYLIFHNLSGSGATFGFDSISNKACLLEGLVKQIMERSSPITEEEHETMRHLLNGLKEACAKAKDRSYNKYKWYKDPSLEKILSYNKGDRKLIFLVEDDENLLQYLALMINNFGYSVRTFSTLHSFKETIKEITPDAVITDIMFPEGEGTEIISNIRQSSQSLIPVIFISARQDFKTRLEAVRAGGYAYFTKPINIDGLIDKLNAVTGYKQIEPYRVLIVDDDSAVASYCTIILRGTGMITEVANDPTHVIDALKRFKPDLILMNIYMPDCNGIELAEVIKQDIEYSHIPFIFLSSDDRMDNKLETMITGGDDFITKPINPERLILSVTNRVGRMRTLQSSTQKIQTYDVSLNKGGYIAKNGKHEESKPVSQNEVEIKEGRVLYGSQGETYKIQNELGRGGMGVTYTAIRGSDKITVVVKLLLPQIISDVKILMRFMQEARTIISMEHINLVKGYDYYEEKNFGYFVMEFIDGKSVEDILIEKDYISPVEATEIVLGISRGLLYLESRNLVHRDIKPANIIINKDSIPKLVDFGLVKMTDRSCSLTTQGFILGTPSYMSPEQVYQTNLDIRSDIYSLGASYYHMVVGEVPFRGETMLDVIHKRMSSSPKPGKVKPGLPSEVCKVIEKMMNRNIKKRHKNASELVTELETVLKNLQKDKKGN